MDQSLTAIRTSATKLTSIEAARALAAFVVVLMHAANLMRVSAFSGHIGLNGIFDFGYVGVDFFFVLSGFIITYVHFYDVGRADRSLRYIWRRFSRIYPIYWIILLLVIGVTTLARLAAGKMPGWEIGYSDIASTLFLLMYGDEPKYVGVAWSLRYEILFYTAFCLLLIVPRAGRAVFFVWGLYVFLHILGLVNIELPLHLGNPFCFEFLLGVCIGAGAHHYRISLPPFSLILALAILIFAVAIEVYGPFGRHAPEGRAILGFASALLLAVLVSLESADKLRAPSWMIRMGSASYSIYLGHIIFINMTYSALLKLGVYHALPEPVVFATAVLIALSATMTIGLYVELPLVKFLKNKGWR